MATRRTATKITPTAPETDIVDTAPETTETTETTETPVVDTPTAEAPKTDKAPITLEALIAAHTAAKAAFVELPDKGDIVGLLDREGELLSVGAVSAKPDTGAMMVQVTWATTMRTTAVYVKKMVKIGPNGWTVQN